MNLVLVLCFFALALVVLDGCGWMPAFNATVPLFFLCHEFSLFLSLFSFSGKDTPAIFASATASSKQI